MGMENEPAQSQGKTERPALHARQADANGAPPIEDLFSFADDPVDFMSAESFPASDPPPPPST